MTRPAAALALLSAAAVLAACPSRRTPPASDASVTAAETAIVAGDLRLTARGQDEWTLLQSGKSAVTIRRTAADVRATDATGEVLGRYQTGELFDANDDLVARIAVQENERSFSITSPAGDPLATVSRPDVAAVLSVARLSPESRAILFVAFRQ